MAYRLENKPPIKPENMLPRYAVRNGATIDLVFRCYYYDYRKGHDPRYHDYINWPAPNYHPGNICQMPPHRDKLPGGQYPIMRVSGDQIPIHLIDEGYTQVTVVLDAVDDAEYITCSAEINEEDDNIVIAHFDTSFPWFEDKPKEIRFTLYAVREDAKDAVCRGILVVLPGMPFDA